MSLISREDAINAADRADYTGLAVEDVKKVTDEVIKEIKKLPSAEKVGKWIEFDSAEDKYDVIKCSFCKHTFTVDSYHWTDIGFIKDDFKYCPNCGADMRGADDDDRDTD